MQKPQETKVSRSVIVHTVTPTGLEEPVKTRGIDDTDHPGGVLGGVTAAEIRLIQAFRRLPIECQNRLIEQAESGQ